MEKDTFIQEKLKLWLAFKPEVTLIGFSTTGSKGCTVVEKVLVVITCTIFMQTLEQCPRIFVEQETLVGLFEDFFSRLVNRLWF